MADKPTFKPNLNAAGERKAARRQPRLAPRRGRGTLRGSSGSRSDGGLKRNVDRGLTPAVSAASSLTAPNPSRGQGGGGSTRSGASSGGRAKLENQTQGKPELAVLASVKTEQYTDADMVERELEMKGKQGVDGRLCPISLPLGPGTSETPDRPIFESKEPSVAERLLDEQQVAVLQLPGILPLQLSATLRSSLEDMTEDLSVKGLPSDLRNVFGESVPLGKMQVLRSGRAKFVFGGGVEMNVEHGAECHFAQHLFELNISENEAVELAQVDSRFVVVPDLDALLEGIE